VPGLALLGAIAAARLLPAAAEPARVRIADVAAPHLRVAEGEAAVLDALDASFEPAPPARAAQTR
jgi:hypothetical protein